MIELRPGDAVPGLIGNGVEEDFPTLGATLEYTERGVRLRIPFFHFFQEGSHFKEVTEWFDLNGENPPSNVLFYGEDGWAHLFRNRVSNTSIRTAHASTGVLSPIEVVLPSVAVGMPDELKVERLRSEADGLLIFSGWKSWDSTHERHEGTPLLRFIDIHVEGQQRQDWSQGEAKMSLLTGWSSEYPDKKIGRGGINIVDKVVLLSEFPDSRPVADHIHEHRVFMDLLSVVLFGKALYFRHHEISDPAYAQSVPQGGRDIYDDPFTWYPFQELLTLETADEYRQELPNPKDLTNSLYVQLRHLPQEVFDGWGAAWEKWKQFILPMRWVLRRTPTTPDDFILNGAIAFERASDILGSQEGEEPTHKKGRNPESTSTHMYRAIHQLHLDWSVVGTEEVGVARAIANHYNGVKHPTGRNPGPEELLLMARLLQLTTRLFGLWIADESGALLTTAYAPDKLERLADRFRAYGMRLTDEGWFEPVPEEQSAESEPAKVAPAPAPDRDPATRHNH